MALTWWEKHMAPQLSTRFNHTHTHIHTDAQTIDTVMTMALVAGTLNAEIMRESIKKMPSSRAATSNASFYPNKLRHPVMAVRAQAVCRPTPS